MNDPDLPRTSRLTNLIRNGVFMPAYLVGALAISIALIYVQWFHATLKLPLSTDPAVWGQFGDYIGGVLNPVCAYMAFIWLVRSYALQKTELAEARDTLKTSLDAQQEQARLALLSAQTQSFNIRLIVLGSSLTRLRAAHSRALDQANTRGVYSEYVADDGSTVMVKTAIATYYAAIAEIERSEERILDSLNRLAIHSKDELERAASLE